MTLDVLGVLPADPACLNVASFATAADFLSWHCVSNLLSSELIKPNRSIPLPTEAEHVPFVPSAVIVPSRSLVHIALSSATVLFILGVFQTSG